MINKKLKRLDVEVYIYSDLWKKNGATVTKAKLKKVTRFILDKLSLHQNAKTIELSVNLTNDAEIQLYNAKYRNKDAPTNVLSFPTTSIHPLNSLRYAQDEPRLVKHVHLGDIVFAFETIAREAKEQSKSFKDHFVHLFVHSVLHLLGFTHDKKKDRDIMEKLEIEILKNFSIESPYD